MALKSVDDVLLKEVREALKDLATSILQHLETAPSLSNGSGHGRQRLLLERLFLLYCRSDDVLEENSEYYCLRLLLDSRSPHATYFIDLFHQLEWLLVALVEPRKGHSDDNDQYRSQLPQDLYLKATTLLCCIRPAVNSCRFLFLHTKMDSVASHRSDVSLQSSQYWMMEAFSRRSLELKNWSQLREELWELEMSRNQQGLTARIFRSRYKHKAELIKMRERIKKLESRISDLTKDFMIHQSHCLERLKILGDVYMDRERMCMLRKAKADRGLPTDSINAAVRFLPFENLDKYAEISRVELGAKLGEGSFAAVYEGNFLTRNHSNRTSQKVGPARAVKVFRNGLEGSNSGESAGSDIHTRKLGSRFFNQMEAVEILNESARSTRCSMEESVHSFSSSTAADCSKLLYDMQATVSHDSFNQTEEKVTNRELSEELWRLVTAKHPNVISTFGYIGKRDEGESGLVMELMSTSLHEYLKQVAEPALQELEVVDLMLEIAKGMRFLHECDIVHRDLKPQNVLLRFNKQLINGRRISTMYGGSHTILEVKLADFGLAQCLGRVEEDALPKGLETNSGQRVRTGLETADSSQQVGTYCYMAPELLSYSQLQQTANNQGSQLPPRWKSKYEMDVFSYGTTCFNILTCYKDARAHNAEALNELIFAAGSRKEAAQFYEAVKSNKWRASVKGKPDYLVDLIAKCWAFDACQRPTFAKICCLLQRALLCILAPPVIDEQALVGTLSRHVLGDVLEPIVGSSNVQYEVIGISRMVKNVVDFARLTPIMNSFGEIQYRPWEYRFYDVLWICATVFREQWSSERGINVDAQSKTSVQVLLQQQEGEMKRRAGAQQFIHNPLTTMDLEWKVFNVLVWCFICSHFRPTSRSEQLLAASIRCREWLNDPSKGEQLFTPEWWKSVKLEPFPFEEDAAKVGLDVDQSLMPFLMCFWESGYVPPQTDNL